MSPKRWGANDGFWPIAARALVKLDANNWSSRMQMTAQWQYNSVGKLNAIHEWREEGMLIGGLFRRIQVSHMKLCASRTFWLVAYS